jgi:hypothetical protein
MASSFHGYVDAAAPAVELPFGAGRVTTAVMGCGCEQQRTGGNTMRYRWPQWVASSEKGNFGNLFAESPILSSLTVS